MRHLISFGLLSYLAAAATFSAVAASQAAVKIDPDDIGGVVTGAKGPEAGVWVIAETAEAKRPFVKIVTTDDHGRYVLPDLPAGEYKVWVRGYGLVDSKSVKAKPGNLLNLSATSAPNAAAAAEIYPANYWFALIEPPPASDFPGTGPKGNGINPKFTTQQHWLSQTKEMCRLCHQLGDVATRRLPDIGNSVEAWSQRIEKIRTGTTLGLEGQAPVAARINTAMINTMTQFGTARGLKMFADWTDKIAAGKLPEVPPRPIGVERNAVITITDWAGGHSVHDEVATDKRNPSINGGGAVYGAAGPNLAILDPASRNTKELTIPALMDPKATMSSHTPAIDQKGHVWLTATGGEGENQKFCVDGGTNKFTKNFPNLQLRSGQATKTRRVAIYDPKMDSFTAIPVCFETHHLVFDDSNTLYFSGDTDVIGWLDTDLFDRTKDAEKAQGWCPLVLDTNGDGKTEPDRNKWNKAKLTDDTGFVGLIGANVDLADKSRDTQISGFLYGININPEDKSVWAVKYSPQVPSGIIRFDRGANPPETCKTEYYEPPKLKDGTYAAFAARGIDIDSKGIAWVSFGNGQLGRFDRHKCKITQGPAATGQHCPEGWGIYDSPGPKVTGQTRGSADFHYLIFLDRYDTLGLGADIPIMPGSNSDSVLAFLPDKRKWVVIRIPYPMGYYGRSVDGRIDSQKSGWKGKSLWSAYESGAPWHHEDGDENPTSKVVQIHMRPDPLAR